MSVIIRLQGLSWSASAADIRSFFKGLSIPPGGVRIIGGEKGDAFIAFSTDEDARQAMMMTNKTLNDLPVLLFLSSKTEMQNTILQAKNAAAAVESQPMDQPPQQQLQQPQQNNMMGLNQNQQVLPGQAPGVTPNTPPVSNIPINQSTLASLSQLSGLLPSNITQALGFLANANLIPTTTANAQNISLNMPANSYPGSFQMDRNMNTGQLPNDSNVQGNFNNSSNWNQNYGHQDLGTVQTASMQNNFQGWGPNNQAGAQFNQPTNFQDKPGTFSGQRFPSQMSTPNESVDVNKPNQPKSLSDDVDEFGRNKPLDKVRSDKDTRRDSKERDRSRDRSRERSRSARDSPRDKDRDRRDRDKDRTRDPRRRDRDDNKRSTSSSRRERDRGREREVDKTRRGSDVEKENDSDTGRRAKKRSLSPASKDSTEKDKKLQTGRPGDSTAKLPGTLGANLSQPNKPELSQGPLALSLASSAPVKQGAPLFPVTSFANDSRQIAHGDQRVHSCFSPQPSSSQPLLVTPNTSMPPGHILHTDQMNAFPMQRAPGVPPVRPQGRGFSPGPGQRPGFSPNESGFGPPDDFGKPRENFENHALTRDRQPFGRGRGERKALLPNPDGPGIPPNRPSDRQEFRGPPGPMDGPSFGEQPGPFIEGRPGFRGPNDNQPSFDERFPPPNIDRGGSRFEPDPTRPPPTSGDGPLWNVNSQGSDFRGPPDDVGPDGPLDRRFEPPPRGPADRYQRDRPPMDVDVDDRRPPADFRGPPRGPPGGPPGDFSRPPFNGPPDERPFSGPPGRGRGERPRFEAPFPRGGGPRFGGPRARFDSPRGRGSFNGPPGRFDGPRPRFAGPPGSEPRFDDRPVEGPPGRPSGPPEMDGDMRTDGPRRRFEGPPDHFEGPLGRVDVPPERFDGPPGRFSEPSGRFSGPPDRPPGGFDAPGRPDRFKGPPGRFDGPPKRFDGPPERFDGSPERFDGPPSRFDGPPERFDRPPERFEGPPDRFDGPPGRFDGPPKRFDGPPERFDGPPERFDGPPSRFDGPPERFDRPTARFDGPPERFDGPPDRFGGPPERFDGPPDRFDGPPDRDMHRSRFDRGGPPPEGFDRMPMDRDGQMSDPAEMEDPRRRRGDDRRRSFDEFADRDDRRFDGSPGQTDGRRFPRSGDGPRDDRLDEVCHGRPDERRSVARLRDDRRPEGESGARFRDDRRPEGESGAHQRDDRRPEGDSDRRDARRRSDRRPDESHSRSSRRSPDRRSRERSSDRRGSGRDRSDKSDRSESRRNRDRSDAKDGKRSETSAKRDEKSRDESKAADSTAAKTEAKDKSSSSKTNSSDTKKSDGDKAPADPKSMSTLTKTDVKSTSDNSVNGSVKSESNSIAGDAPCCVMLTSIAQETSYKDIRRFFNNCEIPPKNGIKILNDETGKRIGKAYVSFANQESFQIALKQDRLRLRNIPVVITPVTRKEFSEAVDSFVPEVDYDRGKEIDMCNTMAATLRALKGDSDATGPVTANSPKPGNGFVLKLSQLPENTTAEAVRKFFSGIRISRNGEAVFLESDRKKTCTGVCLVEFENEEAMKLAMKRKIFNGVSVNSVQTDKKAIEALVSKMKKELEAEMKAESKPVVDAKDNAFIPVQKKDVTIPSDMVFLRLQNIQGLKHWDIRPIFDGLGVKIINVQVAHDAVGKPIGEAFVEFDTNASVQKALQRNNIIVKGQKIVMDFMNRVQAIENLRICKQALQPEAPTRPDVFYYVKASNLPKNVTTGELMGFLSGFQPAPESMRLNIGDANQPADSSTALIGFRIREDAEAAVRGKNQDMLRGKVVGLAKIII